jgi:hypothetical protein
MAFLLWMAGIIALVAQMPELAVAVWLVNVINGLFSFFQNTAPKSDGGLEEHAPGFTCV